MAKILVVDDDRAMREMLVKALSTFGHQVVSSSDGARIVEEFCDHRPDLVIMDLVMPGDDGIKAIVRLRRELGDVKIIAISGGSQHSENLYLPMATKLGAKLALAKPFSLEELRKAVDEVLKKTRDGDDKPQ